MSLTFFCMMPSSCDSTSSLPISISRNSSVFWLSAKTSGVSLRVRKLLLISRTKLYYKIKGLTGETPGNFFRTYQLNRAAELLKSGKYSISEIAVKCGFSTQSHFSVVFKKQFGVTPSEYRG